MYEAIKTMKELSSMYWDAFNNVQVPLLGVSFLGFFITLMVFNLVCLLISVISGGNQDKEAKLDNNNHYIYRS